MERIGLFFLTRPIWLVLAAVTGLAALPFAIWLDLRALSDNMLSQKASNLDSIVSQMRSYYATNIANRIATFDGNSETMHDYLSVPGAIPIPATMSLELGQAVAASGADVNYRFVSDFTFTGRPAHNLSAFEIRALATFRAAPGIEASMTDISGTLWDRSVTFATPVVMAGACVDCHNAHPESPKTDWKVGDVRAIQSVTVRQPLALNIMSFKWVVTYMLAIGGLGLLFLGAQFKAADKFHRLSSELSENNEFLAGISLKISKYLPPQIYKSIFAGDKDVSISTERKKLTVFFSDIKDFTSSTEQMQPEELTELLNDYFTEMSKIAEVHGATIDKFVGDAIIAFFGDPETLGVRGDARACVRMALAMQNRLAELERIWKAKGMEHPFKARMGINTGYCNVGNFGSDVRMHYTIIGAEANLAARMESIAESGGIVMTFETYAHVKDFVEAEPSAPVRLKGIAREVIPYHVRSAATYRDTSPDTLTEDGRLIVDVAQLDERQRARIRDAIRAAMNAADKT